MTDIPSPSQEQWLLETNAAIERLYTRLSIGVLFSAGHNEWLIYQEIQPNIAAIMIGNAVGQQMQNKRLADLAVTAFNV